MLLNKQEALAGLTGRAERVGISSGQSDLASPVGGRGLVIVMVGRDVYCDGHSGGYCTIVLGEVKWLAAGAMKLPGYGTTSDEWPGSFAGWPSTRV